MYKFLIKYYKYLLILLLIYVFIILIRNIFNFYTFLILLTTFIFLFNKNKKLYKKIAYKILFKNKNNYSFKNKYGAAKNSLEDIDEINKKI